MVKINSVAESSPASKCGICEGDLLAAINGHTVKDVLDYMYYAAETEITLDIVRHGEELTFHILKDEYDDLGLEFETFLMDSKQRCSNNKNGNYGTGKNDRRIGRRYYRIAL